MIDQASEFGQRAARRLRDERLAWLTTVDRGGTPQPIPVWFLWDGDSSVLVYSQPDTPKLRNIQANPRVSLNLDGDGLGGDIVVLLGEAHVADAEPPARDVPDYLEKYRDLMAANSWSADEFTRLYSVPIRVTLSRLRGH